MGSWLPIVTFAGLALAGTAWHGQTTHRWSDGEDLTAAAARMDAIPERFGEWKSEVVTLDPDAMKQARVAGFACRRYRNPSGNVFTVLLVCGRPGPVSAHTPDVCYRGAGYQIQGEPDRMEADGLALMHLAMRKPQSAGIGRLDVYWTWTTGDVWEATDNPRVKFAGAGVLYKAYLIRETMLPINDGKAAGVPDYVRPFLESVRSAVRKP